MLWQNYIFVLLMLSAVGIFCYRLRYNIRFMQLGKGDEDVRHDAPFTRFKYMLANGLLQPKMLTDKKAAIMHYVIFYGFFGGIVRHFRNCRTRCYRLWYARAAR